MSGSDAIPKFRGSQSGEGGAVNITNLSAFARGPGIKSMSEVLTIAAVAVFVIGGVELWLRWNEVPHYIMPTPSAIARALVTDFHLIDRKSVV